MYRKHVKTYPVNCILAKIVAFFCENLFEMVVTNVTKTHLCVFRFPLVSDIFSFQFEKSHHEAKSYLVQLDCLTNPTVLSESGDSDSVASLLISSKSVLSLDLQRHLWRYIQYHLNINQAKWKTWYFESDTSSRVPILFESQPVRKNFIVFF